MNTVNLRAPIAKAFAFIAVAMAIAPAARPQSPSTAKPKFDVASVKPCDPHVNQGTNAGTTGRGMVAYNCLSLLTYIRQSYAMNAGGQQNLRGALIKIEGGPSWINSDLYQITAKAEGEAGAAKPVALMMQSLLEDRFNLKIHRETREVPVYALVAGKGGLKLPPAKVGCFTMGAGPRPTWKAGEKPPICQNGVRKPDGVEVLGSTIADFCLALNVRIPLGLDRMIVDKTGIQGQYDFDLKWSPEDLALSAGAPIPFTPSNNFTLLDSALRRIGLRLESAKGPGEFLIIDHADHPTAN